MDNTNDSIDIFCKKLMRQTNYTLDECKEFYGKYTLEECIENYLNIIKSNNNESTSTNQNIYKTIREFF